MRNEEFRGKADYIVHFVKRYTFGAIYFANTKCDYNSQRSSDNYELRIKHYELQCAVGPETPDF